MKRSLPLLLWLALLAPAAPAATTKTPAGTAPAPPTATTAKPASAAPATAAALPSPKLDVKAWSLANGLQVLFLADHKAPIATVQVFYHVGSKDEHVGIRGVAHMFEHMMFKGS
ncbi:MAG TPA: insulinase family protein, partial [Polyangia bacterium]